MSINLTCVQGASAKLQLILRFHKIRSTFYTESTLRKVLCKSVDQVATKVKTISSMKLTVVTAKQSTSANLDGL